jgi:hypothetical protein
MIDVGRCLRGFSRFLPPCHSANSPAERGGGRERERLDYQAVQPPSTVTTDPVT